jgi:type I restriction enzyme S subunit
VSWHELPLRRVFSLVTAGAWGVEPDAGEVSLPCIRGTDFDYPALRTSLVRAPIRGYSLKEVGRLAARRGDLIIEKSGGGEQQPVGRVVIHDLDDPVMPTNFAGRLRVQQSVDPRFACYLLASMYADGLTRSAIKQTTGIQNLDLGALLGTHVRTPSPSEQRAIADYLDAETSRIDSLIEKKRRMVELLEERFECAVFTGITRGLDPRAPTKPSGLPWVTEIPSHWTTPTVSVNFDLQLGKMLNTDAAAGPEQYPYLRNVNVQWDRFHLDDLATMHFGVADRRRCQLLGGDLLVCEGGEVGRAAVWPGSPSDCFYQKAIHRLRPRAGANSRYLLYCLRAAAKNSVFSVEGNLSTIVHLTGEQLRVHRFPWPPRAEQELIVRHLDQEAHRTQEGVRLLSHQLQLLAEHRQALITAAVTGQLAVPGVAA